MNNLQALLTAIKARAEAATKGPWTKQTYSKPPMRAVTSYKVMAPVDEGWIGDFLLSKDAEFATHARQDVPRLVEALEKALRYRDEYHQLHYSDVSEFQRMKKINDAEIAAILAGEGK